MENIWGYGLLFVGLWCLIFALLVSIATGASVLEINSLYLKEVLEIAVNTTLISGGATLFILGITLITAGCK